MFQMLQKHVVDGQNKRVHVGKPRLPAVSCGYHAAAAKRSHTVERTGGRLQDWAGTGRGIEILLGRIAVAGADVGHAVD